MPSDLQVVAQFAKSRRDAPSEVYNAACRMLDQLNELERLQTELAEAKADNKGLRDRLYYANADAARAEAAIGKVMKRLGTALALAEAQRDTARATIERARAAVHIADAEDVTDWQRGYRACTERAHAALDGPESHGDGLTGPHATREPHETSGGSQ